MQLFSSFRVSMSITESLRSQLGHARLRPSVWPKHADSAKGKAVAAVEKTTWILVFNIANFSTGSIDIASGFA